MRFNIFNMAIPLAALFVIACNSPSSRRQQIKHPGFMRDELFAAIESGNIEETWVAVQTGADINARDGKGNTPLMKAVYSNRRNILKILLENGADVNARNDRGETALWIANEEPLIPPALLRMLLESGSDINIVDRNGIHILSNSKSNDKFDLLLEAGANIDVRDNEGKILLMRAACQCDLSRVSFLLERGADRNVRDSSDRDILQVFRDCVVEFKKIKRSAQDRLAKPSERSQSRSKTVTPDEFRKRQVMYAHDAELANAEGCQFNAQIDALLSGNS